MFAKKTYQWNAVDVVRSDSTMQRGLVVDKQESGVLVDLDIAGKKPELIPYDSVYLTNHCHSWEFAEVDKLAQLTPLILRKLSNDQPWQWYSGKILAKPCRSHPFALVEIRVGKEVIVDCVRSEDVLVESHNTANTLRKNDFVREECPLPPGFVYNSQSIAPWRQGFPRTHPIGVVDNKFHYLQLRHDEDLSIGEMVSVLHDGTLKTVQTKRAAGRPGTGESKVKRPKAATSTASLLEDLSISSLPCDLLGLAFSFLNGQERTRIRRVCPAWNDAVLSPECSREMRVDVDKRHMWGPWLFHCITQWTKYVTISRNGSGPTKLRDDDVMLLQRIMPFKSRLTGLIVCQVALQCTALLTPSRTALAESMVRVCRQLIFKDVVMLSLFDAPPNRYILGFEHYQAKAMNIARIMAGERGRHLRIAHGRVRLDSPNELLECFEGAATELVVRGPAQFMNPPHYFPLGSISGAIAAAGGGRHGHPANLHHQRQIINVLKDWQVNDARFGPNTQWRHVRTAQLDANLRTLRNTTLSVLACLTVRWSLEDDDELFHGHYAEVDSDAELAAAFNG